MNCIQSIKRVVALGICFVCFNSAFGIEFLSDDKLKFLSSHYEDKNAMFELLHERIIEASVHNSKIVDYYYYCENINHLKLKEILISNGGGSGLFEVFDWGVVAKINFQTAIKFEDDNVNDMWLESSAKWYALNLVASLEVKLDKSIEVDYAQWCILNKSAEEISIYQLIKFKE